MPQVLTSMAAGSKTMKATLKFGHWVLATNLSIQYKIRAEVMQHVGERADLTLEHLRKVEYLIAFAKELFRIYPTTQIPFYRVVAEDIVLCDVKIPKDYGVTINLVVVDHSPKYFNKPEEFKPERWLEKDSAGVKKPLAYLPFLGVGRRCIGEHLAQLEAKIMLPQLIRFDIL